MIATALILGAAIFVGTSLLTRYWNKVVDVMKRAINKIKNLVAGILVGSTIFIRKQGEKFQNRTKHYSKTNLGKWEETIVSYEQMANEVPEEYQNYALLNDEYDLTLELELQLKGR